MDCEQKEADLQFAPYKDCASTKSCVLQPHHSILLFIVKILSFYVISVIDYDSLWLLDMRSTTENFSYGERDLPEEGIELELGIMDIFRMSDSNIFRR